MSVRFYVAIRAQDCPSLSYRGSEYVENLFSSVPSYAGICYTDAIFQASFAFFGYFLGAYHCISQVSQTI